MRRRKIPTTLQLLFAPAIIAWAAPAEARITVVDVGAPTVIDGYCTPGTPESADCAPRNLPFQINLGGTQYSSFVLNGNGTLTLGDTPINWSGVSNSPSDFSSYPMPVFSPENDNTIIFRQMGQNTTEADTMWAASVSTVGGSLTAYWFPCSPAIVCRQY